MSEEPVPTTKEELIQMLKEQLEKVEVLSQSLRMKSVPCRIPSKNREIKGNSSPSNLRKNKTKSKNS